MAVAGWLAALRVTVRELALGVANAERQLEAAFNAAASARDFSAENAAWEETLAAAKLTAATAERAAFNLLAATAQACGVFAPALGAASGQLEAARARESALSARAAYFDQPGRAQPRPSSARWLSAGASGIGAAAARIGEGASGIGAAAAEIGEGGSRGCRAAAAQIGEGGGRGCGSAPHLTASCAQSGRLFDWLGRAAGRELLAQEGRLNTAGDRIAEQPVQQSWPQPQETERAMQSQSGRRQLFLTLLRRGDAIPAKRAPAGELESGVCSARGRWRLPISLRA